MPLKILSDALVTGDFTFQKSTFTTVNGTGASSSNFTINMDSDTNNYKLTFINGSNQLSFSNLANNKGKAGNIICNNPSSVNNFNGASVGSQAYTPGGSFISWDTTASGIAVVSYLVLDSSKVLINYVGNFEGYPQP